MDTEELSRIEKILENVRAAIERAALNGGVTSYSLNSSQSSTNVRQASLKELTELETHYENKRREIIDEATGAHCTIVRN